MSRTLTISADSHVNEPGDLWQERIGKKWGVRAPHIVRDAGSIPGDYMVMDGLPPAQMGQGVGAGKTGEEFVKMQMNIDYNRDVIAAGFDPSERLKAMDQDGMTAELLIPTLAGRLFSVKNAELQRDGFTVFNDWITEFSSYSPNRLVASGCISTYDAQEAAKEVQRCAKMGHKMAIIWHTPPEDLPFTSSHYDPFWAACQDAQMPVCLHVLTGFTDSQSHSPVNVLQRFGRMKTAASVPELAMLPPPEEMFIRTALGGIQFNIQKTLYQLIYSGVFERFPGLKVLAAEYECDWIPMFLRRADESFANNKVAYATTLTMKPSEYFARQIYCTFTHDDQGVVYRDQIGVKQMVFASDFPHNDTSWPGSQDILDHMFEGVPDEDRAKMTGENSISLFGLDID
jgi:predicted TIM-barrel fold metal-dependent hydrolase